jgi:hypothetical protein
MTLGYEPPCVEVRPEKGVRAQSRDVRKLGEAGGFRFIPGFEEYVVYLDSKAIELEPFVEEECSYDTS